MKKNLIVASIIALSTTAAIGAEVKSNWFTGLEVGSTKHKYSATALGTNISDNESGGSQSIKVGKYFDEVGRAYISYTRYNEDSIKSYGIGYDHMFYNSSSFVPFIGASIGNVDYDVTGLQSIVSGTGVTINKDNVDISGVYYGISLGTLYEINDNLDFEIGVRYIKTTGSDSVTLSSATQSATIDFESDNATQWYIGMNYNF